MNITKSCYSFPWFKCSILLPPSNIGNLDKQSMRVEKKLRFYPKHCPRMSFIIYKSYKKVKQTICKTCKHITFYGKECHYSPTIHYCILPCNNRCPHHHLNFSLAHNYATPTHFPASLAAMYGHIPKVLTNRI